jgi:hypothetical protein
VNQKWQTAFAKMRPEDDFANSNRNRYLKGQSRETDSSTSAKLTHGAEWAAVNQKRQTAFALMER